MLDQYPMMDEFEKFVKLKNLVVGHCTNIFSSMNGERLGLDTDYITSKNGIETSDGLINDYFKTPDFSITPDFRYLKIQRNTSNVVLNNK